jgi:hypothetical protein
MQWVDTVLQQNNAETVEALGSVLERTLEAQSDDVTPELNQAQR